MKSDNLFCLKTKWNGRQVRSLQELSAEEIDRLVEFGINQYKMIRGRLPARAIFDGKELTPRVAKRASAFITVEYGRGLIDNFYHGELAIALFADKPSRVSMTDRYGGAIAVCYGDLKQIRDFEQWQQRGDRPVAYPGIPRLVGVEGWRYDFDKLLTTLKAGVNCLSSNTDSLFTGLPIGIAIPAHLFEGVRSLWSLPVVADGLAQEPAIATSFDKLVIFYCHENCFEDTKSLRWLYGESKIYHPQAALILED